MQFSWIFLAPNIHNALHLSIGSIDFFKKLSVLIRHINRYVNKQNRLSISAMNKVSIIQTMKTSWWKRASGETNIGLV